MSARCVAAYREGLRDLLREWRVTPFGWWHYRDDVILAAQIEFATWHLGRRQTTEPMP
jgi:hypothetical protein